MIIKTQISTESLKYNSARFFDHNTMEKTKTANNIILQIIKKTENVGKIVSPQILNEVYNQFWFLCNNNRSVEEYFNNRKKVRYLAEILDFSEDGNNLIINSVHLSKCINLLSKYYSAQLIIILRDKIFNNWGHSKLGIIYSFIISRIVSYDGKINKLINLKKTISFLNHEKGLFNSINFVIHNNQSVPDFITMMSLDHKLTSKYFSAFLVDYVAALKLQKQLSSSLNEIIQYLEINQSIPIAKKILSILVTELEMIISEDHKLLLKSVSLKMIGDPNLASVWKHWDGANDSEIKVLKKAQDILNFWINSELISYFFEKIAMDRDRKIFWTNYSKKIPSIKICSGFNIIKILSNNPRLKDFVNSRTKYLMDTNESALLFETENYFMVEFSQKGTAFYAYKKNSPNSPNINTNTYYKYQLIKTTMPPLFNRSGSFIYNDKQEGRKEHHLNWEVGFSKWLAKYVGI